MADINTVLATIGSALAADTDIAAFCNAEYSKSLTVFENCDARQDPPASACPLAIISPVDKHGGLGSKQKEHVIGMSAVVHDERKVTAADGVVRFVGGRHVETLRTHILAAVIAASLSNLKLMSVDTEYNLIDQFPFVSANMVLMFHETWTIGSSPFE